MKMTKKGCKNKHNIVTEIFQKKKRQKKNTEEIDTKNL